MRPLIFTSGIYFLEKCVILLYFCIFFVRGRKGAPHALYVNISFLNLAFTYVNCSIDPKYTPPPSFNSFSSCLLGPQRVESLSIMYPEANTT